MICQRALWAGQPPARPTRYIAGGNEPLNGWIALLLYFLLAPGLWAYLQVSLNDLWQKEAEALPSST